MAEQNQQHPGFLGLNADILQPNGTTELILEAMKVVRSASPEEIKAMNTDIAELIGEDTAIVKALEKMRDEDCAT